MLPWSLRRLQATLASSMRSTLLAMSSIDCCSMCTTGCTLWMHWNSGECAGGSLVPRSQSDLLAPGDPADDMFLRDMSLLEPMPSLSGAF